MTALAPAASEVGELGQRTVKKVTRPLTLMVLLYSIARPDRGGDL